MSVISGITHLAVVMGVGGGVTLGFGLRLLQDLPVPEKWTLATVLGFVLVGVAVLLGFIGRRLIAAVDKGTESQATVSIQLAKVIEHNEEFKKIIERQEIEHGREVEKVMSAHDRELEKLMAAFGELRDTIRDAFQDRRRPKEH